MSTSTNITPQRFLWVWSIVRLCSHSAGARVHHLSCFGRDRLLTHLYFHAASGAVRPFPAPPPLSRATLARLWNVSCTAGLTFRSLTAVQVVVCQWFTLVVDALLLLWQMLHAPQLHRLLVRPALQCGDDHTQCKLSCCCGANVFCC
jgi:hypothetical protein